MDAEPATWVSLSQEERRAVESAKDDTNPTQWSEFRRGREDAWGAHPPDAPDLYKRKLKAISRYRPRNGCLLKKGGRNL